VDDLAASLQRVLAVRQKPKETISII